MKSESAFKTYIERLYKYTYFRLNSREDAEDIVSESFAKFIENEPQIKDPKSWLFRTARNLIIDKYRKNSSKFEEKEKEYLEIPDEAEPFEKELITKEIIIEIRELVKILDDTTQEIIILKIWEDMKFEEIAELININLNTVKFKYYEGLKKMKAQLEKDDKKIRIIALPAIIFAIKEFANLSEFKVNTKFLETTLSKLDSIQMTNSFFSKIPIKPKLVIVIVGLIAIGVTGMFIFSKLNNSNVIVIPTPTVVLTTPSPSPTPTEKPFELKSLDRILFIKDKSKVYTLNPLDLTENFIVDLNTNKLDIFISNNDLTDIDKQTIGFHRCDLKSGDYGCKLGIILGTKIQIIKNLNKNQSIIASKWYSPEVFAYSYEETGVTPMTQHAVISIDGSTKILKTFTGGGYGRGGFEIDDQKFEFSEDGKYLFYINTSNPENGFDYRIHVFEVTTGKLITTIQNGATPYWINNTSIAYTGINRDKGPGTIAIHTYDILTKETKTISNDPTLVVSGVGIDAGTIFVTKNIEDMKAFPSVYSINLTTGNSELIIDKSYLIKIINKDLILIQEAIKCDDPDTCFRNFTKGDYFIFNLNTKSKTKLASQIETY